MNDIPFLHYPDGEPCRVEDIIRHGRGAYIGRVVAIIPAVCEGGSPALKLTRNLGEGDWNERILCPESSFASEGVQRLTCTEALGVELLFHQLGQQLGLSLWGKEEWLCEAEHRDGLWTLHFAPEAQPYNVQTYRFEHSSFRFKAEGEPCEPPAPALKPAENARHLDYDGLRFYEGDLIWEEGGAPSANMARLSTIIHPDDEDWRWLYEQEEEFAEQYAEEQPELEEGLGTLIEYRRDSPRAEFTGIDGRSGSTIWPLDAFETECYGKVSEMEKLTLELLRHLLLQQPEAYKRGWNTCLDRLTVAPLPDAPRDWGSYWEYCFADYTLSIAFCCPRSAHIHGYRNFHFERESYRFRQLTEDEAPGALLQVSGGGVKLPWWLRLWDTLRQRLPWPSRF